ncbi:MAG: hypothetical protein AAFQ41_03695 [Cyanobacteria bacterium J06623_7]
MGYCQSCQGIEDAAAAAEEEVTQAAAAATIEEKSNWGWLSLLSLLGLFGLAGKNKKTEVVEHRQLDDLDAKTMPANTTTIYKG